jgi:hypothetical protein
MIETWPNGPASQWDVSFTPGRARARTGDKIADIFAGSIQNACRPVAHPAGARFFQ